MNIFDIKFQKELNHFEKFSIKIDSLCFMISQDIRFEKEMDKLMKRIQSHDNKIIKINRSPG
jgi:hypothetical protein